MAEYFWKNSDMLWEDHISEVFSQVNRNWEVWPRFHKTQKQSQHTNFSVNKKVTESKMYL